MTSKAANENLETGFNANYIFTALGGSIPEQIIVEVNVDRPAGKLAFIERTDLITLLDLAKGVHLARTGDELIMFNKHQYAAYR